MVWSLSSVRGSHALQHGASFLKNFLKYYNSSRKGLTWYIFLVQQHHPQVPLRPLEKFPSMGVNMETSSLPFKNFLNIDVDNNSSPSPSLLEYFLNIGLPYLGFFTYQKNFRMMDSFIISPHPPEKFSMYGFLHSSSLHTQKFFFQT